jgi:hypothetical protein
MKYVKFYDIRVLEISIPQEKAQKYGLFQICKMGKWGIPSILY